jgi:hypothetical protein
MLLFAFLQLVLLQGTLASFMGEGSAGRKLEVNPDPESIQNHVAPPRSSARLRAKRDKNEDNNKDRVEQVYRTPLTSTIDPKSGKRKRDDTPKDKGRSSKRIRTTPQAAMFGKHYPKERQRNGSFFADGIHSIKGKVIQVSWNGLWQEASETRTASVTLTGKTAKLAMKNGATVLVTRDQKLINPNHTSAEKGGAAIEETIDILEGDLVVILVPKACSFERNNMDEIVAHFAKYSKARFLEAAKEVSEKICEDYYVVVAAEIIFAEE